MYRIKWKDKSTGEETDGGEVPFQLGPEVEVFSTKRENGRHSLKPLATFVKEENGVFIYEY